MSCGDTKLKPSLKPYFDKETSKYYILGTAGEPYELADPERFEQIVQDESLEMAAKVDRFLHFCSVLPDDANVDSFIVHTNPGP